jgi:hypothetical protein
MNSIVISQKKAFFIVTAAKTWTLRYTAEPVKQHSRRVTWHKHKIAVKTWSYGVESGFICLSQKIKTMLTWRNSVKIQIWFVDFGMKLDHVTALRTQFSPALIIKSTFYRISRRVVLYIGINFFAGAYSFQRPLKMEEVLWIETLVCVHKTKLCHILHQDVIKGFAQKDLL